MTRIDYKSFNTLENQVHIGRKLLSLGYTPEQAEEMILASTSKEIYICLVEFGFVDDPKTKRNSPVSKAKAVKMYKSGKTMREIASELGFAHTSVVAKWLKDLGVKRKLEIGICPTCGNEFEKTNSLKRYCSPKCEKVANKTTYRTRRRASMGDGIKDRDITVNALYRKENGICYLCGKPTDLNDYKMIRGYKVCGEQYPSIEHLIPLSKGGLHSWENVRLAHRGCNTKKGATVDGEEKVEDKDKKSHGRSENLPSSV